MRPDARDAGLLWDMLRAAREVRTFTDGKTYEDYEKDLVLRRAVERSIQIIGEASAKVSKKFREAHAAVPWRPITAQRHILVHDYGEIDDEKIWRVATHYVPLLIEQILPLVPKEPGDGQSEN